MARKSKTSNNSNPLDTFPPSVAMTVRQGLVQYANSLRETLQHIEQALTFIGAPQQPPMSDGKNGPVVYQRSAMVTGRKAPWYVAHVIKIAEKTGGVIKQSDLTKIGIKQAPMTVMEVVARRMGATLTSDRKAKEYRLMI